MGHPHYDLTSEPSKQIQGSPPDWKAPRLSVAVLRAPAGKREVVQTDLDKQVRPLGGKSKTRDEVSLDTLAKDFTGELKVLFGHLQQRLDKGLGEAWFSEAGYDLPADSTKDAPMKESLEEATFWDEPEEQWARPFVEMSLFSMYHSPNQVYGASNGDIFDLFPKVHSIAMACQILSTYGLLSRGVNRADVGPGGLSCSAGSAKCDACDKGKALIKPAVEDPRKKVEGELRVRKDIDYDALPNDKKEELIAKGLPSAQLYTPTWATTSGLIKGGATPGSVVFYNGGGSKATTQDVKAGVTHSATILRVSGSRLQFFDTGVVIGSGETSGEAGTIDHEFSTGGVTHGESMVALGVAKPVPDDQLKQWGEKTAGAKPLGLTRLVVLATTEKKVLFVSKLLHMRWPVSQLIWSLRGLPAKDITVAWLAWVPRDDGLKVAGAISGAKPAAPSTLLTGRLGLSHVLLCAANEDKPHVFRSHLLTDWRDEKGATRNDYGEAEGWRLGSGVTTATLLKKPPLLVSWCESSDNFNQCYVRTLGADDNGKTSADKMGHALVDPDA